MHVGLNLLYLVPGETGGRETYARGLIPRLAERGLRLTSFVNRETAAAGAGPWLEAGEVVRVPVSGRSRAQWALGEQLLLPRLAARARIDVLHSLANFAPAWGPFARVVTIHDLLYMRHPEFHTPLMRLGTRTLVPLGARRSRRVITVSEASRDELTRLLELPRDSIDVVPNGVEGTPAVEPTPEPDLRWRLGLGERPIVLTVATRLEHKNLLAVVDAAAAVPPPERPLFVLAGSSTGYDDTLRERARLLGVESDVLLLDTLSQPDLEGLYGAATLLLLPSLYEGFGLPVIEAMARGLPVVCSDIPALREVAGDAAVLFEPRDTDAAVAALRRLLREERERERLIAAGRQRAGLFTWTASAGATVASYERAVGAVG